MRRSIAGLLVLAWTAAGACGEAPKKRVEAPREKEGADRPASRSERPTHAGEATGGEEGPGGTAALGVSLTGIDEKDGEYALTFNDCVKVHGVRIREGAGGEFVAFPAERDGERFFPYVRVPREQGGTLLAAVKERRTSSGATGFQRIEVERIHRLEGPGKRKAFVSFSLDGGALRLSSWVLVEGKDGLFLAGPSEKRGDDWVTLVDATRACKPALERAAIEAYNKGG